METLTIYRIYINDKSYIGISKKVKQTIKEQINNIKVYLKNKTNSKIPYNLTWLLNFKTLPKNEENSYKMALYIIENNLTLKDVKWEILEGYSENDFIKMLEKEQYYIDKFNSEWDGFNNLFSLNNHLDYVIKTSPFIKTEINFNKILEDEVTKKNNIKVLITEISNNNMNIMPWTYYSLKDYQIEFKHHSNWLNYCDLMLKKYNIWNVNNKI